MQGQASENTQPPSRRRPMTLVAERVVEDAAAPSLAPPPTTSSTSSPTRIDANEVLTRYAWRQGLLASLTLATRILAARAILLFAVIGAIGLAFVAITQGDLLRLAALGTYLVGGVLPLVWLASRG
jgi:hypothetical protein